MRLRLHETLPSGAFLTYCQSLLLKTSLRAPPPYFHDSLFDSVPFVAQLCHLGLCNLGPDMCLLCDLVFSSVKWG